MRGIAVIAALLVGCGGKSTSEVSTAASISASTGATATTEAPPAAPGLDALPPDAALYATVRAEAVDLVLAALPERQRASILRAFGALGARDGAGLATALGIDRSRPILVALVPAPSTVIEPLMRKLGASASAGSDPAKPVTDAIAAVDPPFATRYRIVVPVVGTIDELVDKLRAAKALPRRADIDRCPAATRCATFTKSTPALVAATDGIWIAAHAREGTVIIDVVTAPFVDAAHAPAVLSALDAFAGVSGGPRAGRCAALDPAAAGSVCIDADAMAEHGASWGMALALGAVQGGSLDPALVARIATVGTEEATSGRGLAMIARPIFDDGTLVVTGTPGAAAATASWRVMPAGKAVADAFAEQRCARGGAVLDQLLVPLRDAVGDVGNDFADGAKRIDDVRNGGWQALLVVLARSWPNLLPHLLKTDAAKGGIADVGDVCFRHRAGRFEVTGPLVVPDSFR